MLQAIRNLWDNVIFLTKGVITERLEDLEAECLTRRIASANEWAVTNSKLTQVIHDVNRSRATLDESTEIGSTTDRLLTVDQVTEILSVSRTTVYSLLKSGELLSVKLGSSRRITDSALEEFIARKMTCTD